MSLTVVIGGTRSGKSVHAERLALATGLPVRYVATAIDADGSMADRIATHVARRPTYWESVDAGDSLADSVLAGGCTLIDGLGVWLATPRPEWIGPLIAAAAHDQVIVVAEEAGLGLLPLDRVSQDWIEALGAAAQRLSAAADRVEFVLAGRAITLHSSAPGPDPSLRHHGDRDVRPGEADHAVNVMSGGPPGWLREALIAALDTDAERYPDDTQARNVTAARHGRDPDEIVVTNGAAEALWLLGPSLRPRLAACVHPGFTEAEAALHVHGIPVVRVLREPEDQFALDPRAVPDSADLVIVVNPSWTLDPAHSLLALRRPGRVLVIDESFMDMVPSQAGSLAGERLDDVIVIRSLTKVLSVPGLRVGYALAPSALAARLRDARPPWSANALALTALTAAAAHPAELAALAERAVAERLDLVERLETIAGLRVWPSAANFCLIEVPDGPRVVGALHRDAVAVRPASSFPGLEQGHIRITARGPEANARLVNALQEALA
ncbi:MAG TPA: bifunctional adenosylcobinamide kinase/adenosylcobinamide-phosphate guanylyltransferase [Solirubrobacteraceae bacterium]|nr:bifunctional adenosylcobinamide kinase/adenosylcobinamide-phosphate guanylyltransferase [Solirubrobacteraceae bacterium]